MCGGGGVREKSSNFREISLIKPKRRRVLSVHIGCVSCGQTDLVGFVVPQYKWRSPKNVCEGSGVGEKSGNFREISLIEP